MCMSSSVTKAKKRRKIYESSKKRLVRKGNFLVFTQKQVITFQDAEPILFLFLPLLTTCSSLNIVTGTQTNSLCRWFGFLGWFWGWVVGFFASLCPCIFWPNAGGYGGTWPINLDSFVRAGADADLRPCPSL